jgi:hypothetical protein
MSFKIPKADENFVEAGYKPLDRCPSFLEMHARRRTRPPMGRIEQKDKEGHGEWMYYSMPGDWKDVSLQPVGTQVSQAPEEAIAKAVMTNFMEEFPALVTQAQELGMWMEGEASRRDPLKTVPGDQNRLLGQNAIRDEGAFGSGLLLKLCFHHTNGFRLNFSAHTALSKVMRENPGRSGTFQFKKGDLILKFPNTSSPVVGAQPRYHGHAWAARPCAARFLIATTAVGTGKQSAPRDHEWIPPGTLQQGVPSRSYVPVMHWTGEDGGEPQEFALMFRFFTKGEHPDSDEPAGMGFGDSVF